jgi:Protein of unknown function (DUF2934)
MVNHESARFDELVEKLAYQFWEERGRPSDSAEQDWVRAEQVIRHHLGLSPATTQASPPLPAFSLEPNE